MKFYLTLVLLSVSFGVIRSEEAKINVAAACVPGQVANVTVKIGGRTANSNVSCGSQGYITLN